MNEKDNKIEHLMKKCNKQFDYISEREIERDTRV